MIKNYRLPAFCALIITLLITLLYVPFLNSELIFDDFGLFSNLTVFDFARTPFGRPRTFPYFSISIVHVFFGSVEANRILSLIIHILCSLMLFRLLLALQHQALISSTSTSSKEKEFSSKTTILAALGAIWFALNPVAVYGAGYLVQRTILFATLFSLLSLWYYRRAFAENRTVDIVSGGLFYAAAVFSKEHAIMLPMAALALTALYECDLRLKIKRATIYLLICTPSAIAAVLAAKTVIATSYEPDASAILLQLPRFTVFDLPIGQWPASIMMQMGFFFDYLGYWIVPDIRALSADMRIDFTHLSTTWWFIPKVILFIACPIVGLLLIKRGKTAALFGCGLLYSWSLFLTELVTIRFQEPFVLYRSYIWAPGYILMGVAICRAIPKKLLFAAFLPLSAILILLARERLQSLASEEAVWMDAATKLPGYSIPGDDRILYNRGRAYLKQKEYKKAIKDFSYAIAKNPNKPPLYYARGIAWYSEDKFQDALADFTKATLLEPRNGLYHLGRGMALEKLECTMQAQDAYKTSSALGVIMAQVRLEKLNKNDAHTINESHSKCLTR